MRMRWTLANYYIRDARDGIRRNPGASLAAVLLIAITLTTAGLLLLLRGGVQETVQYLESQVKIKLFLDPSVHAEQMKELLSSRSWVKRADVETKADSLDRLKRLFSGKEHLFRSFQNQNHLPDMITLELASPEQASLIADELAGMQGVTDVIFAQKYAEAVLSWSDRSERYGIVLLLVLSFLSAATVTIAIQLAMYRRQKEIRVKLLLGAKDTHVRGQFLLEGGLLGLLGGLLASILVYLVYDYAYSQLTASFGSVFSYRKGWIELVSAGIPLAGMLIGLAGSMTATRRWLHD
ncbi:cell division protein FtsX [Paenibacillus puerhi]|uniref:cell division protein FtsX n=1 Tax=Paenibacillus puerhi TaxID=2692622 RepID=UPI001F1D586F|nr:permease-like cell division protein FtsX [Paenibacillus puerhi]